MQKTITAMENSRSMTLLHKYHEDGQFKKVVEILTSQQQHEEKPKTEEEKAAALQRLYMLVDAQWNLDDFRGCLDACARALALAPISTPSEDIGNLLKTVEMCLEEMEDAREVETVPRSTRAALCRNITPILLHEIDSGCAVARPLLPWTVFYSLLRCS